MVTQTLPVLSLVDSYVVSTLVGLRAHSPGQGVQSYMAVYGVALSKVGRMGRVQAPHSSLLPGPPAHLPTDTTILQVSNIGLTPTSHLWTASNVCLAIQQGREHRVGVRPTWV